ncbi:MFS transporter [Paenibacillus tarimensis]
MEDRSNAAVQDNPARWRILAAAALAIFMAALDMNILNVALPSMARQFKISEGVVWISLSYSLTSITAMMAVGRLTNKIGIRPMYLWGIGIFLSGSVMCFAAVSFPQLLASRVVQGVGAAGITAPLMALAASIFKQQERGRAMGIVGLIGPLGGIAGPALGGLLIELWGWRSVFLINVPVGLLCFTMLHRLLPKNSTSAGRGQPIDWLGIAALSGGSLLMLLGISLHRTLGVLVVPGALILSLFIYLERKVKFPVLPIPLLARPGYALPLTGIASASMTGSALGVMTVFFLQHEMMLTTFGSGLILLFVPLAMMPAAQIGGWLTDRYGTRVAAMTGLTIGLTGLLTLVPLDPGWTRAEIIVRFAMIGFGHGLFHAPVSVAVMAATPREYMGVSSAVSNVMRSLGFALGPAVAAMLWIPGADADSTPSMRTVLYVLIGVQCLVLASAVAFKGTGRQRLR